MKHLRSLVRLVLAAALAASAAAPRAEDRIRLGILPFSESLGAVIADRQGFFKAEGIEVEMSKFDSGALALPLLQSGRLDIAFSNTVATLQAMEQGLDAVILAPGAAVRDQGADTTTGLMVLKGGPRSPKELEGKRVAVNVINSSAWLYLVGTLDKYGVDRAKVRILEVPFPQMNDPLLNRQVDAIAQVEPFRSVLNDTGKVEAIAYTYVEVQPGADITQYVALSSWVKKNPALAARFARAIERGAQFANADEAATREINQQFTNLNPALKDRVMLPRFGSAVSLAQIARTQELMIKYGLMKKPVDLAGRTLAR